MAWFRCVAVLEAIAKRASPRLDVSYRGLVAEQIASVCEALARDTTVTELVLDAAGARCSFAFLCVRALCWCCMCVLVCLLLPRVAMLGELILTCCCVLACLPALV